MLIMADYNRPVSALGKMFHFPVSRCFFLVLILIVCDKSSTEILRPRGVPISQTNLYDASKNFTCFNGVQVISFDFVNDDYCDCSDGSDEPGTAACPHGKFYCTNAGHVPGFIPSSRVNDNVCDCCDGEDEYSSGAVCANNCHELGKSARLAAQQYADLLRQGGDLRMELIKKGQQLKNDKKMRLEQLKQDEAEADRLQSEFLALKEAAEEREKTALEKYRQEEEEQKAKMREAQAKEEEKEAFEQFQRIDSDSNGVIVISELQTRQTFDKDRNGEVSEEEARYFLEGGDSMSWETFLASGWLRMKPYILMEKGLFTPPSGTPEPELETSPGEIIPPEEDDIDIDKEADGEGATAEGEPVESEVNEHEADHEADHDDNEEEETDVDHGEPEIEPEPEPQPPPAPTYDQHTLDLIEAAKKARKELEDAESSVRNVRNEIRDIETALAKDYGPDEEFTTLEGSCYDFTDTEYTYQFCPFEEVVQKPRSGASPTRLGSWGTWAGPADNKYSIMMYDRGVSCWNGPQRTAQVNIKCGLESSLISATEPNRCEYLFEFQTPAACRAGSVTDTHDEL